MDIEKLDSYFSNANLFNLQEIKIASSSSRFLNVANSFLLQQVTIPDTVTTLTGNVFQNCYNIKEITIPNSVRSTTAGMPFLNWQSDQVINIDNTEEFISERWNPTWKEYTNATINYLR